MRADAAGRAD